eukprot:gene19854-26547_t
MAALMMKSSSMTSKVATRRSVAAKAAAGNWRPGSAPPAWLKDANMPGNFGGQFDLAAGSLAIKGEPSTYFGMTVPFDLGLLVGVELVMMAIAEGLRGQNSGNKIYPGGSFDPMGMSKDAATFEKRKLQEIKNGRLAMMACVGLLAQDAAGCKSPLTALGEHIASPYTANFATNGISLPF